MSAFISCGMIYLGSILMAYNIVQYVRFSGNIRTKGDWKQERQILQFPICVLMVTSRAFIHIDRRHSCEKVSLLGHWPLRQAAKRVTSTLREVPGARAPPRSQKCSCNFWLLGRLGTSIHGV